jgi:hypothetical protein
LDQEPVNFKSFLNRNWYYRIIVYAGALIATIVSGRSREKVLMVEK